MDGNNTLDFEASLLDGPRIDLWAEAGIENAAIEAWFNSETNWKAILSDCPSVELSEGEEFEGSPGQSDTTYQVTISDQRSFRLELRHWILMSHYKSVASSRNPTSSRVAKSARSADRIVEVGVEWGYDMHYCPMTFRTWERILKGQKVFRREPYWYEGERFSGEWHFNQQHPGSLYVGYDDGGTGFEGDLSDAGVTIDGIEWKWR